MYSIAIRLSVAPENNFESIKNWINCINSSHKEIYNWFSTLIGQNILINKIQIDVDGTFDTTFYYANDYANACLFADKFQNQKLNFSIGDLSMKQFWNHFEFNIDINILKITDKIKSNLLDLVDSNTGEIWNTKFPLTDPYDYGKTLP